MRPFIAALLAMAGSAALAYGFGRYLQLDSVTTGLIAAALSGIATVPAFILAS